MKFFSCRCSRQQRFDRVSFGASFQTGKTPKRNSPTGSSSPVSSYGRLLLNSTWGKKGWKITFTLTNFNFNWMITVFWPCHFFYNSRVQGGPYFYTYPYPSMKGFYFPLNTHHGNVDDFSCSSFIRLWSRSAAHSQSLSTIHPQNLICRK